MPKKIELIDKEEAEEVIKEVVINPITTDFGREDLNQLRDTVNQLIEK